MRLQGGALHLLIDLLLSIDIFHLLDFFEPPLHVDTVIPPAQRFHLALVSSRTPSISTKLLLLLLLLLLRGLVFCVQMLLASLYSAEGWGRGCYIYFSFL